MKMRPLLPLVLASLPLSVVAFASSEGGGGTVGGRCLAAGETQVSFFEAFDLTAADPTAQAFITNKQQAEWTTTTGPGKFYADASTWFAPLRESADISTEVVGRAYGYCSTVALQSNTAENRTKLCWSNFEWHAGRFKDSTLVMSGPYKYDREEPGKMYGAFGSQAGSGNFTITGGTGCFAGAIGMVGQRMTNDPNVFEEVIWLAPASQPKPPARTRAMNSMPNPTKDCLWDEGMNTSFFETYDLIAQQCGATAHNPDANAQAYVTNTKGECTTASTGPGKWYGDATTWYAPLREANDVTADIVGWANGYCVTVALEKSETNSPPLDTLRTQLCISSFVWHAGRFAGSSIAMQGPYWYEREDPDATYGTFGSQVGDGSYTIIGGTGCVAGAVGTQFEQKTLDRNTWREVVQLEEKKKTCDDIFVSDGGKKTVSFFEAYDLLISPGVPNPDAVAQAYVTDSKGGYISETNGPGKWYGDATTWYAPLREVNDVTADIVGWAFGYCVTVALLEGTDCEEQSCLRTQLCISNFKWDAGPLAGSSIAMQGPYWYEREDPNVSYGTFGSQVGDGSYTITGGTGCFAGAVGVQFEKKTENPNVWEEVIELHEPAAGLP